ncbi:tRNA 2-selenouridine(34) synthase MnmH [Desulfurobacterium sp.]
MSTVKEIDIEQAVDRGFTFVDVRTPEEFKEFHIPRAYNVPLFTSEEKRIVSEVYREKGEKEARLKAVEIVSPKIPSIVSSIAEIKKRHENIVIYCWRGGLRSLAVATFCNLAGVFVFRLKGGYRAFRQFILRDMEKLLENKRLYVIYGPTGCAKTCVLRNLIRQGFPAIDLEGLAGHRGSVFGNIGLKQPSQKMFDALLWAKLRKLKNEKFIIVEGESKRIGRLFVPEPFWRKMETGVKVMVELPLSVRVEYSMKDYCVGKYPPEVYLKPLGKIKKYLSPEVYKKIETAILKGKYREAVELLMVYYYDKLYKRSMPESCDIKVAAGSVKELEDKVVNLLLYQGTLEG